tara:strand:- start:988 stop:1095 length:108 start_codon:yes stop_codon:yes gene_type:complete
MVGILKLQSRVDGSEEFDSADGIVDGSVDGSVDNL